MKNVTHFLTALLILAAVVASVKTAKAFEPGTRIYSMLSCETYEDAVVAMALLSSERWDVYRGWTTPGVIEHARCTDLSVIGRMNEVKPITLEKVLLAYNHFIIWKARTEGGATLFTVTY